VIEPPGRAVVDARDKPGAGLGPVDDVRLAARHEHNRLATRGREVSSVIALTAQGRHGTVRREMLVVE
jgi:hypothetical protein